MNMKRRSISLCISLLLVLTGMSQEMLLGIWKDGRDTERFYHHSTEAVVWKVDGGKTITVPANKTTYFTLDKGKVRISTADKVLAHSTKAERTTMGIYNLKGINPPRKEEKYNQPFKVTANSKGLLLAGIILDFESYVAGVMESESGKEQGIEYYKVQALICRTYALSNKRRHEHEGFNLCDQVHCQVYHGMSRFNPDIIEASQITAGQVIVDSDMNLINATFHSNCGGHTVNSEEVWSKALPYLRAKEDTFCLEGKHATWESQILRSAWFDYMEAKTGGMPENPSADLYSYKPSGRSTHFLLDDKSIPLKDIRSKWFLNSTYFEMAPDGERLILKGRGFGHGVGLCQEGAMSMIRKGYSYQEALAFYYTDVHLVHLSVIDFFKKN
jgi:stage II sporulation protein D